MKNRLKQSVFVALLYGVTAMVSLNLTSCEEGGIDSQPAVGVKLGTTAQTAYTVTSVSPRDIKFTVTSNTPWTITSNQTWCAPTPVSSTVSALVQEVTVTMTDNELLTERKAVLTIQGEGVEKQEITITQDSKGALSVAMFETEVPFIRGGEVREFTVVSNKDWTITSDKAWLTFDVSAVAGSDKVNTVKTTVGDNPANIRRATITIKNGLEEKTYQVTQDGNQLEVANGTDTLYLALGETKTYQLLANLAWKAEVVPGSEWVEIVSGASGDGNGELVVKAGYNFTFAERVGKIKLRPVTPVAGLENVIVLVRQPMGYDQVGTAGTITYNENGSVTFETTGGGLRYCTKGLMKNGTFVWKFSDFNIGTEGCFNIHADGQTSSMSGTNSNFIMWLGPTYSQMSNCGGDWGWQPAADFDVTGVDFTNIKEIKLEVLHDEGNTNQLRFTLYVNGTRLWNQSGKTNPFVKAGVNGVPYYWGFNREGAASFTLDSFTFTPEE